MHKIIKSIVLHRIIILALIIMYLFFLFGFEPPWIEKPEVASGRFLGIMSGTINLDSDILDDTDSLVIDQEMALEIADVIFRKMWSKKKLLGTTFENTEFIVSDYARQGIFVVTRCEKLEYEVIRGGGCISIAVDKKDGRIVKIWWGE